MEHVTTAKLTQIAPFSSAQIASINQVNQATSSTWLLFILITHHPTEELKGYLVLPNLLLLLICYFFPVFIFAR